MERRRPVGPPPIITTGELIDECCLDLEIHRLTRGLVLCTYEAFLRIDLKRIIDLLWLNEQYSMPFIPVDETWYLSSVTFVTHQFL